MINYISDLDNVRIQARSLIVRPVSSTRKIVSQLIDGSHTVQQISSAAEILQVSVIVKSKNRLDEICETCEPINIVHYGRTYTGIISSNEITWEPIMAGNRWYRGSFEFVVTGG